jgi:succinate dehydrogenase / fumarate reductase membrane anchor subunit
VSRTAQGLRTWLVQRFTAIYLALYVLAIPIFAALSGPLDYDRWKAWLGAPWVGIATALFAVAVLLHGWIGVREVLIDYVHALWLRLLLLAASGLVLLGSLLWVLRALVLAATGSGPEP